MYRSYEELIKLNTFLERYKYLKLDGDVGQITFGGHRYLNQILYKSPEWKQFRNKVIIRDNGCDLGVEGFNIFDHIFIHHINPITIEDVINRNSCLFDMNNVISTSFNTHQAIHYGDENLLGLLPGDRKPGDTKLW